MTGAVGSGPERGTERDGGRELVPAEVEGLFERQLADAFAALGTFNLAIFGPTGVGKSTLVNAIFGRDVAATGIGQPVTRGLNYHRMDDGFLGLYDSEGFETGTAGTVVLEGLRRIVEEHRAKPVDERIHAVWYLVRWSDRRFEPAQQAFVRALAELGLPVILVFTQVPTRDGMPHPEAVSFAEHVRDLGLPARGPVLTNALADPFTGAPVTGLTALLDETFVVVPEAAARALTAAQVVDLERKKAAAAAIVRKAAALAAGIGATPIPVADAALLVPNQVQMIARVTAAWGLPPSRSRAMAVAGTVVLTGGATMAGRYAVTTLLKFVPGGAIAGSAISGTVAAGLTAAVGHAWSRVCELAAGMEPAERDRFLASPQLLDRFQLFLREGSRLVR